MKMIEMTNLLDHHKKKMITFLQRKERKTNEKFIQENVFEW